jgi:hypothetical protein
MKPSRKLIIHTDGAFSSVPSSRYSVGIIVAYYFPAGSQITGSLINIVWHVDQLLGNDRKISNDTTAVVR